MTTFEATAGRLDAVVAAALGITRVAAQRAIEEGRVLVGGATRAKAFRLAGGEAIEVDLAGVAVLEPAGEPVPVRWRDAHLAVVAKPAGLVTHPAGARHADTLVHRLLATGIPLAPAGGALRPGIVHRLDAGTSGLLVVASDDATFAALQAMFRVHAVERTYLALVRGNPDNDRFVVDAPLGRRGAATRADRARGRAAAPEAEVLERLPRSAFLSIRPRTGRTHQIRVHLAAVGHPILGDGRYGGGGDDARALGLARPFLHSARIAFAHPVTGERIDVEEPLPEDLRAALALARG
ncbi:MAG: RluA family pseudouridine synthase [Actinomycetota bacterium]